MTSKADKWRALNELLQGLHRLSNLIGTDIGDVQAREEGDFIRFSFTVSADALGKTDKATHDAWALLER